MQNHTTIWVKFSDLTSDQLKHLGIAGRMQSSASDEFAFSLDGAKKIGLTEEQMKKARVQRAAM